MNTSLAIGRLLRAGTGGFVVGCRVSQLEAPEFGALVRVPLNDQYQVYGLIHDIHIDDDGLVRQLVTAEEIAENVVLDNRVNRNVPVEISVLTVGFQQDAQIVHLLPPRPPLSLDAIFLCDALEVRTFTSAGRFGYFRLILRMEDVPTGELLAAHLRQAHQAHLAAGDARWIEAAVQELVILLRDDYPILMSVLGAVSELWTGQ